MYLYLRLIQSLPPFYFSHCPATLKCKVFYKFLTLCSTYYIQIVYASVTSIHGHCCFAQYFLLSLTAPCSAGIITHGGQAYWQIRRVIAELKNGFHLEHSNIVFIPMKNHITMSSSSCFLCILGVCEISFV